MPSVSVAEAQRLLSGPRAAIVEFVAGRDRTIALVVTLSRVSAFTLKVTTPELGRQVQRFRDQLANRDLRAIDSARALYDLVLGPLHAALQGATDLIIVPDGVLWDLPFQALQSSAHRYVIEDMAVSYAPSITVLREMMRLRSGTRAPRTLLAFGNPAANGENALPETENEVHVASRRFMERRAASTWALMPARIDGRRKRRIIRVVHLATHGVLDNASPLYSHLLLARPERGSRRTACSRPGKS